MLKNYLIGKTVKLERREYMQVKHKHRNKDNKKLAKCSQFTVKNSM
jgi:hypothetical protein